MRRVVRAAMSASARRVGLDIEPRSWPVEASPDDVAVMESALPYTMVSRARLWSAVNAVKYVVSAGICGDVVEAGVWRGGCSFAMASTLHRMGDGNRGIWLYDTFDGMTAPTVRDVEIASGEEAAVILERVNDKSTYWARAQRDQVARLLSESGVASERLHLVRGDVRETLPSAAPEAIAVLRLDTDWYESTRWELETLYDRVSVGGVIIIDDYGHWEGARAAVDEFFSERRITPLLHRIDYSGRQMIKL